MTGGSEEAAALRRAALSMAIEYHDNTAQHPNSKGPARPAVVTATADEFYRWLQEVGRRSGIANEETR